MEPVEFLRSAIRQRIDSEPTLVSLDELTKHDYIERGVVLWKTREGRAESVIRAIIDQFKHEISKLEKKASK